jgi:hypothetical protein
MRLYMGTEADVVLFGNITDSFGVSTNSVYLKQK